MRQFKFCSLLLLLLAPALLIRGQDNSYRTHYMQDDFHVGSKRNHSFLRQIAKKPTGKLLYEIVDLNKNGEVIAKGHSVGNNPKVNRHGIWMSFREDGTKISEITYANNQRTDIARFFYRDESPQSTYHILQSDAANYSYLERDSVSYIACWDSLGNALMTKGTGYYVRYDDNLTMVLEEGAVKKGKPDSVWNGQTAVGFQFTEVWDSGKLLSGTTTDREGNEYAYTQKVAPPEYPGGIKALMTHLSTHIDIPKNYIHSTLAIDMAVRFRVLKDGKIEVDGVIGNDDIPRDLEIAAENVVKTIKPWKPGFIRGVPTEFIYIIPISIHTSGTREKSFF